jgi:SAM-dependent methyltransferase
METSGDSTARPDVAGAGAAAVRVEGSVDLVEAIRLQAEEHPLIDDKAPETLAEKCLHLMHVKAYDEAAARCAGRDVLDVGCNTGYGTVRLVPVARSVTGVDVSPAAVAAARTREGGEAATFEVIDGLGLPFPDDSFDLVTSFQVVEHVLDPVPYLQEIRRVLRPGGIAILTTPNAAIRLDPGMTPWNRFHVREYRADELKVALGEVFDEVEVLGMFGVPTLYDLEIERVDANRRGVRARQAAAAAKEAAAQAKSVAAAAPPVAPAPTPSLPRRVRRRLGRTSVGRWARGALGRTGPAAPASPASGSAAVTAATPVVEAPVPVPVVVDFAAYAVGDLFYSGRDLDRSMDLMAVCTIRG